jgi:hypothetical protein
MYQLAIHTQNIESCSDISVAPREIMVAPRLQPRKCNWLVLIPRVCASTMSFLCPRGFLYSPFFLVIVLPMMKIFPIKAQNKIQE